LVKEQKKEDGGQNNERGCERNRRGQKNGKARKKGDVTLQVLTRIYVEDTLQAL
jgi:hypothetical protein